MQNIEKEKEVRQLCQEIINISYSSREHKAYFDYDLVIEQLENTKKLIQESERCPKPKDLPKNMIWSERYYNPDEEIDPYVFDGTMSIEDHEKWQQVLIDEEMELEP